MENEEPNIFVKTGSAVADFFTRWWREATGPIEWHHAQTPFHAVLRRVLLWVPVAVLAAVVFGSIGLHFFVGWRARDLARKAVASAEEGRWPAAQVQIGSARNLRPEDPAVQCALAVIETKMGLPSAAKTWSQLPEGFQLTKEELEARALAMMRNGDEPQYAEALAALEEAGFGAEAAAIRVERNVSRGNLQQGIAEARAAVRSSDTPAHRLTLARLLLARHGVFLQSSNSPGPEDLAGAKEISDIADSLLGAPEGEQLLALIFANLRLTGSQRQRWSAAAWKRPAPDNPALLPAATAMIAAGDATREEMTNRLKAVYAGAEPSRKTALAAWLVMHGGDPEGALVYLPPAEATRHANAFLARCAALSSLGRWEELRALAEGPGSVPRSLMSAVAAQANAKLDRGAQAEKFAQDAVRTAAREGTIVMTLRLLDESGFRELVDREVVALCGETGTSELFFRLARERFGRGGQPASLQAAYERAAGASPHATAVQSQQLYDRLLSGSPVDPQQTAAALAASPTDVNLRLTHALALLKTGRAAEALAVFDEFDVFVEQLPPGQQAIAAAILGANGQGKAAEQLARSLDPDYLAPGEYALIAEWRAAKD
ncbi:MAG: hypothetical protein FGM15_01965 [Chthoniobacterales bacterium]|nr:hypothetical protein [Chthoniobacterales bacterium]